MQENYLKNQQDQYKICMSELILIHLACWIHFVNPFEFEKNLNIFRQKI